MKKTENLMQKMFGSFAIGSSRVPIRSNVYRTGGGYTAIGGTSNSIFDSYDRKSPLLGNASPSNRLSGYLDRISELKGYQLLDISKLATNFFADYITNFLVDGTGQQLVTIMNQEGDEVNDQVTDRINDILTKDLKILDWIRDHLQDYVFFGEYFGMLQKSRDDTGHLKFRIEEINDPVCVITKKKRNKDGEMEETYLAKGEDGVMYEIPSDEIVYIAAQNLRLVNDLSNEWNESAKSKKAQSYKVSDDKDKDTNRSKVLIKESYMTSEPLLYAIILKVKELIIKELLVSLISLRDLSSVQIFLLQFDKSIPLESANELCARATKLANNTNELGSFLSSQFDIISFIENTLTQSAKFVPDYNSTLGGKNSMLPLDKLTDKLLDIMQTLDSCRANILGPLGLPTTLMDSTSGNKWQVLQQSERANSRVSGFMTGIKDSVVSLVCNLYKIIYDDTLDPALIKLHISEKTSVEYNNQINQSESINGLVQGVTSIVQNSLQTLETAAPLIDGKAFLSYIQNQIKSIDPNTEALITDESIEAYLNLLQAKVNAQYEQLGVEPPNMGNENGE
jgi:hypothetical protein